MIETTRRTNPQGSPKGYCDRHFALRKRAPGGYAASTYSTARVLLDTAKETKSVETEKLTRALEGYPLVRRTWLVWPANSRRRDLAHLVTAFETPGPI
jgi:hypothetical protein